MSEMNRREFMFLSAMAGTGLSLTGLMNLSANELWAQSNTAVNASMTNLTTIAITEDCARLALYANGLQPNVQRSVTECWREMRTAGSFSPLQNQYKELLDSLKSVINQKKPDDFSLKKLALASGWAFNRAAVQELYASDSNPERMMYHDVFIIQQHSKNNPVKKEAVKELLQQLELRTLLRIHTFIPDERNIDQWVPRAVSWSGNNKTMLEKYAEIFANLDQAKMKKWTGQENFYRHDEDVITLARSMRTGVPDTRIKLNTALDKAKTQSTYARALAQGFTNLKNMSAYLTGNATNINY